MTHTPIRYIIPINNRTSLLTKNETKTTCRGFMVNLPTHFILNISSLFTREMNRNECGWEDGKEGRKRMKWKNRDGLERFHMYRLNDKRVFIPINHNSKESIHITHLSFILNHRHNPFISIPFVNQFNTPLKHTDSRFSASLIELKTIISVRIPQQEWYNYWCIVLVARIESKWHATVNLMSTFERYWMVWWDC